MLTNKCTFYELLEKDGSVSIHKQNLRFLACEMFDVQTKRDTAPELIKELILPNRQLRYELKSNPDFAVPIVKSVHIYLEGLSHWELLPLEIKKQRLFIIHS